MQYISIHNNQSIALKDIPEHAYPTFMETNTELMKGNQARHCVNYFGYREANRIRLICLYRRR